MYLRKIRPKTMLFNKWKTEDSSGCSHGWRYFIFDFCLTLMHLLGANFCVTYLSPFSKLLLNANPVLVCFIFWFPEAGRALIFGQHGHLDNFRAVNKYFKQRGLRSRQTRNTVNNVTAFPCFFFFFGLFCFSFAFRLVLKICCNFAG